MSNPKMKAEEYQLLGGINQKISQYLNTPLEFLDIRNFDFQTPGALTEIWGSTQYVGQTFSGPISTLFEFSKLNGASYLIIGHTGGMWYGATTGNSQGMSFTSLLATMSPSVATQKVGTPFGVVWNAGTTGAVILTTAGANYKNDPSKVLSTAYYFFVNPFINGGNKMDFVTFEDYLFGADGDKFIKFDGVTTTPVGLPNPTWPPTAANGTTVQNAAAGTTVGISGVTPMSFGFYASYVNNRGFESQIWPVAFCDASYSPGSSLGGSFILAWVDMFTPLQYGISSINVYSYASGTTMLGLFAAGSTFWNPPYVFMGNYSASGGATTRIPLGTTSGNFGNMINNVGAFANPDANNYLPFGFTLVAGNTTSAQYQYNNQVIQEQTGGVVPRYLEVFENRLFAAGFSSMPSTVAFSGLAEPEGFALENSFEARTNDGDVITHIHAYGTRLYVFKRKSFYALLGDNPNNFALQEVTLDYGCINNSSCATYNNLIVFLDQKGLMQFNGSSVSCISDKVQPIFDRMNYSVAINTAMVVHDKLRNQILVAIPVDGASANNLTVVYDYLTGAWTTHDSYQPTALATIQGRNNTKNAFYGTSAGTVNWFGPSFLGNNGVGFTAYFKTRFLKDAGESVEKQFRRLYMNADVGAATFSIPIKFYQDYGSSVVLTATMPLGEFQNRIDFGIPAKSIAFELFNMQTTSPLKIYGFTIESRIQRRV